jgi:hypothetical protein
VGRRAAARPLGAADTELNREPGIKFDPIIVLEGPMGTNKSKAIEILSGVENFSDQSIFGVRDREQQELLAGVWLYEIAELSNIRKTEVEHIKSFASRTHDRARPAYGRARKDQPGRGILFATTNNDRLVRHSVVPFLANDRTRDRSHLRSLIASLVQSPFLKFPFMAPRGEHDVMMDVDQRRLCRWDLSNRRRDASNRRRRCSQSNCRDAEIAIASLLRRLPKLQIDDVYHPDWRQTFVLRGLNKLPASW